MVDVGYEKVDRRGETVGKTSCGLNLHLVMSSYFLPSHSPVPFTAEYRIKELLKELKQEFVWYAESIGL